MGYHITLVIGEPSMKSALKLIIILVLTHISQIAMAASTFEIEMAPPAISWIEARSICQEKGFGWDLPKVSDILEAKISEDLFTRVPYKDLKTQKTSYYNLVWVRSDEDELNVQLIENPQALKYIDSDKEYDAYPLSAAITAERRKYLGLLKEKKNKLARTQDEQAKVVAHLENYHKTSFGSNYPLDEDLPLELQPEYVPMLPRHFMPLEILTLLYKPSLRFIETEIDNLQYELESTSNGLDVVCVKNEF